MHVLPENFYKIRYYGILASRNRHKLRIAQEVLGAAVELEDKDLQEGKKSFEEWFFELTGIEAGICPYCKKGRLIPIAQLAPVPP